MGGGQLRRVEPADDRSVGYTNLYCVKLKSKVITLYEIGA